jgi:hypothetical protein
MASREPSASSCATSSANDARPPSLGQAGHRSATTEIRGSFVRVGTTS